ncbi:ATP-grasp domain-containing protein [Limosilactobacillus sp.]|uniref:carbamoyl phosphate synthase preATP-grasp domain-containing protein n=1 Tax=Limosilactobacillus sp. TaxID=2773925 RepID=UPI003F033D74
MADKIHSVLIIGAGANDVQHGDELDAATFQVTTEFKKQGVQTILVDNNPFSVSLEARDVIDHACIGPLDVDNLLKLIDYYKPQAILPTLGNRRAFELTQKLLEKGVIQERNIQILGVPEATIHQINNPVLLSRTLHAMNAPMKSIVTVDNYQDALQEANRLAYPVIIRSVLPKSSSTRRIVHDQNELATAVQRCLKQSQAGQVLVQQSLAGYKEIEVMVQRDRSGTMMMLSMVEDMDPIGIHAGDSVAFNPPQTLLDRQIQDMRDTAFAITRKLRIVGVNHVQFALNPANDRFYVIKNSPYFDRMTSFVAQSTGYPIAKVCAHLYLGQRLRDIELGDQFVHHAALVEPTMDHIAARVPVWGFNAIPEADRQLITEKKSVGTVFGVGRSPIEAMFKAIESRYQEPADFHLRAQEKLTDDELVMKLVHPEAGRLFTLIEAMRRGYSVEELSELTKIDPFYFDQINRMRLLIEDVVNHPQKEPVLVEAKYNGLSNQLIARLWKTTPAQVYQMAEDHELMAKYKEIEPSGGEFTQHTGSFYSALEDENEATKTAQPSAMVIGTGGLRLGLSNAGDYVVAMMMRQLRRDGFHTVVVNANPSSVNLSYTLADKRYIEPATGENILQILRIEQPQFLFVPASYTELRKTLAHADISCQIITIPDEGVDPLVGANKQLVAFNYLDDGKYAYSLGPIATSPATPTTLRYPADLGPASQQLAEQGLSAIMEQNQPGLFQVIFERQGDDYLLREVCPLPLPTLAFLSKALGLDLTGIYTQILTGKAGADEITAFLKHEEKRGNAVYRACFPFKALHVPDATPAANKIIGAQMDFLTE